MTTRYVAKLLSPYCGLRKPDRVQWESLMEVLSKPPILLTGADGGEQLWEGERQAEQIQTTYLNAK